MTAVGYSLGNRNDIETDIQVVAEDEPNVLTFSHAAPFVLSRMCRNSCPYCSFHRKDSLAVPYSTIKIAKTARAHGIREAFYVAGERPDKYAHIRSVLDLWGFASYLDYIYTVCELGFLEGLIPVIEMGFLSPIEMKKMSEIVAVHRIMLDSVDDEKFATIYPKSPGKKRELRLKQLEWAGRLKVPTVTGLLIGIGETKEHRRDSLKQIAEIHTQFGTVSEVHLQAFHAESGTPYHNHSMPSQKVMLESIQLALSILPSDITVTVSMSSVEEAETYIKAGIRDFGQIIEGRHPFTRGTALTVDSAYQLADRLGLQLMQRFPLKKGFIKSGLYSKKLGQVFDAYRYKIKKDTNDKGKDGKP